MPNFSCYFCFFFTGGFCRGYCSRVSDLSDFGRCKLVLSPLRDSCDSYVSFIGSSEDLSEYDPSDPFGNIDPDDYPSDIDYIFPD